MRVEGGFTPSEKPRLHFSVIIAWKTRVVKAKVGARSETERSSRMQDAMQNPGLQIRPGMSEEPRRLHRHDVVEGEEGMGTRDGQQAHRESTESLAPTFSLSLLSSFCPSSRPTYSASFALW